MYFFLFIHFLKQQQKKTHFNFEEPNNRTKPGESFQVIVTSIHLYHSS